MTVYAALLAIHITAGFASLFSSFVAMGSKLWNFPHRWHQRAGKVFFAGMVVVFMTAVPMSILRPNTFLFMIAFFSFYLAFAGWRVARNRTGNPGWPDWAAIAVMSLTAAGMLTIGVQKLVSSTADASGSIVLFVFAALGAALTTCHAVALQQRLRGTERIGLHVSMMMGATISTLTAFVVVNAPFLPTVLAWLGPTFLLTPVIVVMQRRLRRTPKKFTTAADQAAGSSLIPVLLISIALVVAPADRSAAEASNSTVVEVTTATDATKVQCAAFDDAAGFPNQGAATKTATGTAGNGGKALCTFENLEGTWAFAVYDDENSNGKLDTAAFGRPIEPYGFSNDAKGRLGPPPWKKAAVVLKAGSRVKVTLSK